MIFGKGEAWMDGVLLASGVQMQLQVASPKVREKGSRGLVRKWARRGVLKRAAEALSDAATHCSSDGR